ncbi:MAG: leucine-rich repeat domain-containing protein, partial [Bacteroidales bacterium]|nr:leucine-rich repeat domain-containing protein [Bacteroidales bacterium]
MKKLTILILALISANVLLAQSLPVNSTFDNGNLKFKVSNATYKEVEVCGFANNSTNVASINIPSSVTGSDGVSYTVKYVGQNAFKDKTSLTSVIIPNSIQHINSSAFQNCTSLAEVTISNGVTKILSRAFQNTSLTEVTIPNSVTNIGNNAFEDCSNLTSVTIGTLDNNDIGWITLGSGVFKECPNLTNFTYLKKYCPNRNGNTWNAINIFYGASTNVTLTIPFADAIIIGDGTASLNALEYNYTNLLNNCFAGTNTPYTWAKVNYLIPEGKTKTLTSDFAINYTTGLENNGILKIAQGGQLINETSNNNLGIVEVETASLPNDKWSFIGAPFAGYKLESVVPGAHDISVSTFNYGTGAWSD